MISGMHASVSSHLSYYYKDISKMGQKQKTFPNLSVYLEKVGYYPERMQNLHFATYILLRAFNRYYP